MTAMQYGTQPLDPALEIRSNLTKWFDGKPRLTFKASSVRSAKAWQRRARARFMECLGPPPKQVPLRRHVLERQQMDGYHRTTFTLTTAPHLKALCWLCIPDSVTAHTPRPAMIATPGHGIGAKDLLAMDMKGNLRTEGRGYQKDYALQVVRLGYPVLVVEPLGFGERRDRELLHEPTARSGCHAAATLAIFFGTTLASIRIHDLRRSLDFLCTVPQVRPDRIGLMGISGGGQLSLWAAAIDPRFKLAVVSGYLNKYRDALMPIRHCICNFIPNLPRELDMSDLATLIAPRPILFENGTKDRHFPIKHSRGAMRQVRQNYRVFEADDRLKHDVFAGEHQWSGRRLPQFLRKWL